MKTSNDTNTYRLTDLNRYLLFTYAAEMGDGLKSYEGIVTGSFVSFAKVHISESVVAIYVARTWMDSNFTENVDKNEEATGELVLLYDQQTKKFRLFKNSLFFDLFSRAELSQALAAGVLAPLSFEDVVGMATASGRGDMPNVFTHKFPDKELSKYISDTIVGQIAYDNAYTVIDEELLLPAIVEELKKLNYCTLSHKRFSSPVFLKPSSSWEEAAARQWLISTLNPQFPCFNLFKSIRRYKQHIQRKIRELEQQNFDKGIVEVKFYDVYGLVRTFHAIDDLDHTEIQVHGTWHIACDLDICCVSPAERRFLKDLTYTANGDDNKMLVPWEDIISIKGKEGKRRRP